MEVYTEKDSVTGIMEPQAAAPNGMNFTHFSGPLIATLNYNFFLVYVFILVNKCRNVYFHTYYNYSIIILHGIIAVIVNFIILYLLPINYINTMLTIITFRNH